MKKIAFQKSIVLLLLVWCGCCLAAEVPREGFHDRYDIHKRQDLSVFGVYWREAKIPDYIYLAPAHLGATLFTLVGNVVTWVPSAVYEVSTKGFALRNFLPPIGLVQRYFSPIGAYALGTPFWLLKKGVYDAPVALFTAENSEKVPGAPHREVRDTQMLGTPENIPLELIEANQPPSVKNE